MGKSVSDEGKLPFGINGIKVAGANQAGTVISDQLYIYQQRSTWMYDLMDDTLNVRCEKINITGVDKDGYKLPSTLDPASSGAMLADNTFCIFATDGITSGYVTKIMENKYILNDGSEVYPSIAPPVPPVVDVTGVTVAPTTLSGVIGGTGQITATVAPDDATNKNVSWVSSAPSICTVSDSGLVTYVAAGSSTVTATTEDGGFTADCSVTVTAPVIAVTGVTLDKTTLAAVVGDAPTQLTATVAPANATDKSVSWESSDTAVCTVSSTGLVTIVGEGSSTVTVTTTDGGQTATCDVTVTAAP